jgi:hypothetical protein
VALSNVSAKLNEKRLSWGALRTKRMLLEARHAMAFTNDKVRSVRLFELSFVGQELEARRLALLLVCLSLLGLEEQRPIMAAA